jgi:hypothetical protein
MLSNLLTCVFTATGVHVEALLGFQEPHSLQQLEEAAGVKQPRHVTNQFDATTSQGTEGGFNASTIGFLKCLHLQQLQEAAEVEQALKLLIRQMTQEKFRPMSRVLKRPDLQHFARSGRGRAARKNY